MRRRPELARLVDVAPVAPRRKRGVCEAVVLSPTRLVCPVCASALRPVTWAQAALVWMHGHGGTVVVTILRCGRCGYGRHHRTATITPRTHAR